MQIQLNINLDDRLVAFVKKALNRRVVRGGLVAGIATWAVAAYAIPAITQFSAGETISSSAVNANFAALASASWNEDPSTGNLYSVSLPDGGGNIGIGTSTPDSLLTVGSDSIRGLVEVRGNSVGGGSAGAPAIALVDTNSSGGHVYGITDGYGSLSFFDSTAETSRVLIDPNGNVGIGTPSPSTPLDVVGVERLEGTGPGTAPHADLYVAGSNTSCATACGSDTVLSCNAASTQAGFSSVALCARIP